MNQLPQNTENTPLKPLKLTIKQRKFIKHYIELGNATEAAKLAGYKSENPNSCRSLASQELSKLNIPIQELMSAAGIDDLELLRVAKNGLNLDPAHSNTPRYLETSLRLRGHLKSDSGNGSQGNISVQVTNYNAPVQVINEADKIESLVDK